MEFLTDQIRTFAIAGHGQSGKTSLVEHLLQSMSAIKQAESVDSGKTVCDYTPEEIDRKISIYATLVNGGWHDKLFNIWDTPGSSDFIGEVITSFRSSEFAVVVLDAKSGVQIETIKYWRNLDERNMPRLVFINKLDEDRASFENAIKDLKTHFSVEAFPVTFPIGFGAEFTGVVDVLNGKAYKFENNKEVEIPIPEDLKVQYKTYRDILSGAAAEGDDDLLVKFIDEGELSDDDIAKGLTLAIKDNRVVPVFAGSATLGSGLIAMLDFIADIMPTPHNSLEIVQGSDGNEVSAKINPDGNLAALVVKTSNDQFSGRLSYIKVVSGVLHADTDLYNVNEQKKERVGKLYRPFGKKLVEVKELVAGDLGVAVKLSEAKTNHTLADSLDSVKFIPLKTPNPIYSIAVSATEKKNEDKMNELLFKTCEEDMTLSYSYNPETAQNVLSGMGDLHTAIILDRIKQQAKIEIAISIPRIAYRETIQRKAQAEYTHKKQSGGHGQFGRVVLAVEPMARGEKYKFSNAVFGGAISKGYIPGVEKGVIEAMEKGVLAGYPVVDVATTVLDGKEHPVDSSEMAFKIAARSAFKDAMRNAGPILLEPVMNLNVLADSSYLGDIMSDLSSRRGRILGQSTLSNGIEEIRAQVPHKELLRYAIDLRSITSGTGSFEVSFDHYAPISGKTADQVIAEAKSSMAEKGE